jgi:saccharopine dehydrogenase-like NADP-dependent oxidoreductase
MRILLVGAGGVGSAMVPIATRRAFFSELVVADYDPERARRAAALGDDRVRAATVDASSAQAVTALCVAHRITHVVNAVDPRFVLPIFTGALAAGADYLDMAMSLSRPDASRPYERCGVKLGDEQFAADPQWREAGRLALVGIGVEPGLSDVFARYAADELFSAIDEIGVRDGANLTVEGYDFAPSFSIWTTIEECLNPPVVWERDRGWFTTAPFSEPEVFDFPEGIGPVECVNVEHEEVVLIPRWVDARRVTFKYGLGNEFIEVLKTLHKIGLDRTSPVTVGGARVSPRDVVAACLPDPAGLGDRMRGKTCAGTWVRGTGKDGRLREVYLYHVVDNAWSMAEYGAQAVVWQTAINPVVALELLAEGTWVGTGVLGPEAFAPMPFLDKLVEYGSPWGLREMTPAPSRDTTPAAAPTTAPAQAAAPTTAPAKAAKKAAPAKPGKKAAPAKTAGDAAPAKAAKRAAPAKTAGDAAPAKPARRAAPAKEAAPTKPAKKATPRRT